jgi:sec-independent protein translocase protein TatB
MFDIAWSELLLIAIVALIFIGPKELPQVLRNLGRVAAKLRRSADEFRRHFEDSMRESGYDDLHKNIQDFRSLNPTSQLKDTIERAINQDYTAKPAPPPEQPAPPQPEHSQPELPLDTVSGDAGEGQKQAAASAPGAAALQGGQSHNGAGEGPHPFEQWTPEPQKPAAEPAKDHATPIA